MHRFEALQIELTQLLFVRLPICTTSSVLLSVIIDGCFVN